MNMSRDQAKDYIKSKLPEYLQQKGIDIRKPFNCLNPSHNDRNPSMSFDSRRNKCKCFSCGASYDTFDVIAIDYSLTDPKDIFNKAYEIYGIQVEAGQKQDKTGQNTDTYTDVYTHKQPENKSEVDYSAYYKECSSRLADTDYHRGLSLETLERHLIGYDPAFNTKDSSGKYTQWKALIIPTGKGSYVARNTDASAGHRDRYRKRGAVQIFNKKTLQTAAKPIFIVEGEIDAMSIEEAGGAAIGLGSLDNIGIFLKLLETNKPSQPLLIALDAEQDKEKQEEVANKERELITGLERLRIPYYRYNPSGEYKDANEALQQDREAFVEAVTGAENIEKQAEEEAKQAYISTSAGAQLQQFINGIGASIDTPCIKTGFSSLDEALDGGLYEGLHIIGAVTSLGKTTFVMQVADAVAQGGTDVLIFSLEMARAQLMSKSISRHTLQIALNDNIDTRNAKTSRGITDGKRYINYNKTERDLINRAITEYGKYADRLYISEGVGDIGVAQIRETIERHIHFTGRRPLVIVDYLQILAPYNERFTDKQNTDKAVLELKRISRDYKTPVIAISSLNRDNYNTAINYTAFKESGAVEYSSDVLIGLQFVGAGTKNFSAEEAKRRVPRQVELIILKNRDYKTGEVLQYDYYSMFNTFIEKGLKQ